MSKNWSVLLLQMQMNEYKTGNDFATTSIGNSASGSGSTGMSPWSSRGHPLIISIIFWLEFSLIFAKKLLRNFFYSNKGVNLCFKCTIYASI